MGTCILFKKPVDIKIRTSTCDDNGRYVILFLDIIGVRLKLATIYAPNEDNPFFKTSAKIMKTYQVKLE